MQHCNGESYWIRYDAMGVLAFSSVASVTSIASKKNTRENLSTNQFQWEILIEIDSS